MIRATVAIGLVMATLMHPICEAQNNPAPPAFEVASIRPMKEGSVYRAGISIAGDRVQVSGPLKHMMTLAYSVRDYQISGGPSWANSDLYEIIAKTAGTVTVAQARPMLQALLVDRFQLKLHRENREFPIYALLPGKNGSKLKESANTVQFSVNSTGGPVSRIVATNVTMATLCSQLGYRIEDRPVRDRTGLTGHYDLTLEWTPVGTPPDVASGPSIFTAIQEQLGLKLEAAKESGESLVIDRVERPTEN